MSTTSRIDALPVPIHCYTRCVCRNMAPLCVAVPVQSCSRPWHAMEYFQQHCGLVKSLYVCKPSMHELMYRILTWSLAIRTCCGSPYALVSFCPWLYKERDYRRVLGPTWSATSGRETKLRSDIRIFCPWLYKDVHIQPRMLQVSFFDKDDTRTG